MDRVIFGGAVATVGGCQVVNGRTTNEMIAAVVSVLLACFILQFVVVILNCRARRKRLSAAEQRRERARNAKA